MSTSFPQIDLTGLNEADRLLLAEELLDIAFAPPAPLTPAQLAEMEHRDADADAGLVQGEPWETVRERLKSRE